MEKFIYRNKRAYELSKLSAEEFVKLGFGSKADYYKRRGIKEPVKKEVVEPKKKEAGK